MHIFSIVKIEKLKLFEPSMIMDQGEEISLHSIDDFSPEYLEDIKEDIILHKRTRNSCRGDVDYLRVGLKGTHPIKAKWIEKEKVRELFPHLHVD
jgi:hypothetical protein